MTTTTDWPRLRAAFDRTARPMVAVGQQVTEAAVSWAEMLAQVSNTPEAVAGPEGLYFTRAALDPAYATPEALDALVASIMGATDLDAGLWLLTMENRSVVAAAAIRGWAHTHPTDLPTEGITWGRVIGTSHVMVTREP